MPNRRFGSVALIAALAILPTLSSAPASAQSWLERQFNRIFRPAPTFPTNFNTYTPYTNVTPYSNVNPYYAQPGVRPIDPLILSSPVGKRNWNQLVSSGRISHAEHARWVDSIEARVARGELTTDQGNLILTRGYE